MQTLTEIKRMLAAAGLAPSKKLGQCFLFDQNLMTKVLELADLGADTTVLEIGPGTGSMTEDLLERCGRLVAVELDHGLCRLLRKRLAGRANFELIEGDVLHGKHALNPEVLAALAGPAHLVANLPYNAATPVIAECLLASHRGLRPDEAGPPPARFERLTFMIQREVADRLAAGPGSKVYGPVSVIAALLGRVVDSFNVPASAFWPRPKVVSKVVRIDFDPEAARQLTSAAALADVLRMTFMHRRKQIGWLVRHPKPPYTADQIDAALTAAGIDRTTRAEGLAPETFRRLANTLAGD